MRYNQEFKDDEKKLHKFLQQEADAIKAAKNKNMSISCRTDQSKWTRRIVYNIRLPKWLVNKALLHKGALLGGIGRYVEELIVKDLGVEDIRKDLYDFDEE